jgi:hypothetical protein
MIRTQIQLTEQQVRRLRAQAREQGVSLAEMIRRCVDKALADGVPNRIALYDRPDAQAEDFGPWLNQLQYVGQGYREGRVFGSYGVCFVSEPYESGEKERRQSL